MAAKKKAKGNGKGKGPAWKSESEYWAWARAQAAIRSVEVPSMVTAGTGRTYDPYNGYRSEDDG